MATEFNPAYTTKIVSVRITRRADVWRDERDSEPEYDPRAGWVPGRHLPAGYRLHEVEFKTVDEALRPFPGEKPGSARLFRFIVEELVPVVSKDS